jgi:hypothetical protein
LILTAQNKRISLKMAIFKRFLLLSLACLGLAGSTLGRVSEHSIIRAQEEEQTSVLTPKKFAKPSSIEKNLRNDVLPSKIETKSQYNERTAKQVPQKQYRRRDVEENVRRNLNSIEHGCFKSSSCWPHLVSLRLFLPLTQSRRRPDQIDENLVLESNGENNEVETNDRDERKLAYRWWYGNTYKLKNRRYYYNNKWKKSSSSSWSSSSSSSKKKWYGRKRYVTSYRPWWQERGW